MPKSIQIVKQSTVELPGISSYKLTVQTANAEDMSSKIFVKQRVRNFAKGTMDDVFVAVCTPTQLEDFEEDSPGEGSSYFRSDYIELIGRTPEFLQEVFDTLIYETKKLVVDLSDLETLSAAAVYNITATGPVTEVEPAPVVTVVVGGLTSLTINFVPASGVIGSPVVNYQYSLNSGVSWQTVLPKAITSPIVIDNLQRTTTYGLQLRAVDFKGRVGQASTTAYVSTQS